MTIRKEFLGRGFAFPFHFDPAGGGVAMSEYEENIRQNISIILGTQPGERQMLPAFGCRIRFWSDLWLYVGPFLGLKSD